MLMAKKDSKSSDGSTATATADGAPVFSADALSKLTQRIQTDFDKAKSGAGANKGVKHGGKNKKEKGKGNSATAKDQKNSTPSKSGDKLNERSAANLHAQDGPSSKLGVNRNNEKRRGKDAVNPSKNPKLPVSARQETQKRKHASPANAKSKSSDPFPKKAGTGRIDKEALLREIVELGGTQEDLALVADIESDDSQEEVVFQGAGNSAKDVNKKDIETFMKEIGLNIGKGEDAEESAVEEEWQDELEDDGEEEEDKSEGASQTGEDSGGDIKMEESTPMVSTREKGSNVGSKLLFSKRPDWHAEQLPPLSPPLNPPSQQTVKTLHGRGESLLSAENDLYSKTELIKSSDRQFLSQIMQSGTLTDKISALTLICQESPLHTTKTLENLHGLAKKKSRSQAIQALGAIKDLFAQGVCLPPNRKLKFFAKQPDLGSKDTKDVHLLVWAYEDWLKSFYFEVLKTLEQLCTDQLVYARTNAVGYVYELLKEKPEQEANLLRVLVNKLGDTDKKVASKVSYLLLQLMNAHPAMKSIIIKAVESGVIFRPGNSTHAKYYAIITLNQTVLASLEHDVANKLLDIYFGVFTSLLHKENATTGSGSTTGKGSHTKFSDHPTNQKMNKKAIARAKREDENNQFEEEVNAKLISAVLTGVNRAFPFSRVDDDVFERHMDTLFRITHGGNFNTSIQALMLIYQVSSTKQSVSDRFYRTLYESLLDQRLINSSKQALYLNLLFRALKSDTSSKRVKAFMKRVIQTATLHQPSYICGVLYLLSQLENTMPSIRTLITDPEANEDDEEEVFRDVPDKDDEAQQPSTPQNVTAKVSLGYDGRKRDPLHANADRSCLWELLPFVNHFHPTVALYATHLLEKKSMPSKPDLGLHTLAHFLDKFVYRNAKSAASTRGTSIMQPLAGGKSLGMVLSTRDSKSVAPVNTEAFWKKKVEDVKPEEVFFHRYFNLTQPTSKKSKRKGDDEDSEAEEGEIWKALVESRPEVEGNMESVDFDDEDLDLNMSSDEDLDLGDDDDDEVDLGDEHDEWDTEASDEEEGVAEAGGDPAAVFEAQVAKAAAKRQKMLDDSDEEFGGVDFVDDGGAEEVAVKGKDGKKRRKLKHLPMFASAEDFADMLSDSE